MFPLFRFFIVTPPVPSLMTATFAAIVAVAAGVLVMDPLRGEAAMAPVLVLQLFAAASGFSMPARRGHYDLLLTSGRSRLLSVLAHWIVSISPGVAAWILVGMTELVMTGGTRTSVFAPGTFAALALVSTLPWALSATLPRFAASVGWLLAVVTIAAVAPPGAVERWVRAASGGAEQPVAAAVFLLYPLAVVGRELGPAGWTNVAPGLAAAGVAMVVSCRGLARADFPLEAAQ